MREEQFSFSQKVKGNVFGQVGDAELPEAVRPAGATVHSRAGSCSRRTTLNQRGRIPPSIPHGTPGLCKVRGDDGKRLLLSNNN